MRHTLMTEDQEIEQLYMNTQPEYLWYIRHRDFNRLAELMELASDLEAIPTGNASRVIPREVNRESQTGARRRDPPNNGARAPNQSKVNGPVSQHRKAIGKTALEGPTSTGRFRKAEDNRAALGSSANGGRVPCPMALR
uniref:Uncharacterized protein n=1 Tax=Glossina pallidipes TaxID=7398 RepID=A0A1B0A3N7_GLOPL